MPFDVFVSHASKDRIIANAVCARLESAGIRCWIAPRDIVAGTSYGEAIIEAIHAAKVMVLVFSSNANSSGHIPKEVERAVSNGVAILPFRIEDVAPGKSLDYFIGSIHWLDAMTPPMERHLDALVETVRKLLPVPASVPGAPSTPVGVSSSPGQVAPFQSPPASAQIPFQPTGPRPATSGANGLTIPPKTLQIGVAAIVVIAAIVAAVIWLKPKPPVSAPVGTSSPVVNPSPVQPGVNGNPSVANNPSPVNPAAGPKGADPIVGCYRWFNNGSVVIYANGIVNGGPFTAHWRLVSASQRAYKFTWPDAIDTITIAPDQRSLGGMNQYQYPISATRIAGNFGLAGTWTLSNNVPMLVFPNGTFSASTFTGTWRATDASRGMYSMTWPAPVDSVNLSADGQTISGANQYGVAISGTRTGPCPGV